MKVRATLLESVDERQQNWLTESIEAFMSMPIKSESAPYVEREHICASFGRDSVGLGCPWRMCDCRTRHSFILPAETTLRVRLVASVHDRISALAQMLNISTQEAAHRVREIDRERVDFVQDHFQRDPTDPRQYDLVLNTGRLTVTALAGLIIDFLHQLQVCLAEKEDKPSA